MHVIIEPVGTEYIRQLARARPALEDQLTDIYQVLTAVSDGGNLREESPLDSARAAYVAYLRGSHLTFNQLVADIAAVCACLFLQESVPAAVGGASSRTLKARRLIRTILPSAMSARKWIVDRGRPPAA